MINHVAHRRHTVATVLNVFGAIVFAGWQAGVFLNRGFCSIRLVNESQVPTIKRSSSESHLETSTNRGPKAGRETRKSCKSYACVGLRGKFGSITLMAAARTLLEEERYLPC